MFSVCPITKERKHNGNVASSQIVCAIQIRINTDREEWKNRLFFLDINFLVTFLFSKL